MRACIQGVTLCSTGLVRSDRAVLDFDAYRRKLRDIMSKSANQKGASQEKFIEVRLD